ncbi:MAG: class I SAM-dependent methyltransferase [Planctomycetes bacterium]|nr:class I SAM-dependent methyltransferase [Planctomycetota bacterium]
MDGTSVNLKNLSLWLLVVSAAGLTSAARSQVEREIDLAPFVPSPQPIVDKMLELADVTSSDVVYDLGCGDGRIVVTAAKKYGARGVGVDFDPERVEESLANVKKAEVEDLVRIIEHDAMTVDLSDATVVTLYLLPSSNVLLRPRLEKLLKPGSRVVSHDFAMKGWTPTAVERIEDEYGAPRRVFLWVIGENGRPIPPPLSGTWTWKSTDAGEAVHTRELVLRQDGATITGELRESEKRGVFPLATASLEDGRVRIVVPRKRGGQLVQQVFTGKVGADAIDGEMAIEGESGAIHEAPWRASRQPVRPEGRWSSTSITGGSGEKATIEWTRAGRRVEGYYIAGGDRLALSNVRLEGSLIHFTLTATTAAGEKTTIAARGWIERDSVTGEARPQAGASRAVRWSARREAGPALGAESP